MFSTTGKKTNSISAEQDINARLQQEFDYGVLKFANNPLHQKLKSDQHISEKLTFVPKMLFFVLGFKDLMSIVRYAEPQNELEQNINIHSDEDSYHWEWFLSDLEYMNGLFKNTSGGELVTKIWDNESLEVRNTIYLFARYMQEFTDPIARMLMVEVLEMTFDKFKEAIHPPLKEADLYDRLSYFGKKHQETEENHTTGISEDEISGLIAQLPEDLKEDMLLVIAALFNQMYQMAANWAEAS